MAKKRPKQTATPKKEAKRRFSPAKQAAFLAALEANGSLRGAARAVRLSLRSHYTWLMDDQTYPPRFKIAKDAGVEMLIAEAVRRATTGKRPSDLLLMFLIKAARPQEYRDNARIDLFNRTGDRALGDNPDAAQAAVDACNVPDD
jgi:hypothetical protein